MPVQLEGLRYVAEGSCMLSTLRTCFLIFVSLVTCCLVALRIHLHRLRVRAESQARFEDAHNLARERINLRTEKMKTRYDTKATGHQFKEGDKVWFYNPTRRKGLSRSYNRIGTVPIYNFKDNKRRRNPDP
ncbi:retrovirus-related Pol polyprotein from transposon 412 [Trichonephila clavipes]|nr:retrovirus-related Pol polyprotein from transposon 412 [Trichonephila clavipes]